VSNSTFAKHLAAIGSEMPVRGGGCESRAHTSSLTGVSPSEFSRVWQAAAFDRLHIEDGSLAANKLIDGEADATPVSSERDSTGSVTLNPASSAVSDLRAEVNQVRPPLAESGARIQSTGFTQFFGDESSVVSNFPVRGESR
jgi:hypothetical protein